MKQPNNIVEVFLSVIKYFILFALINNLAWIIAWNVVMGGLMNGTAEITQTQDGTNNYQEMTNG